MAVVVTNMSAPARDRLQCQTNLVSLHTTEDKE